jgi:hypothetical protein
MQPPIRRPSYPRWLRYICCILPLVSVLLIPIASIVGSPIPGPAAWAVVGLGGYVVRKVV